MLQRFYSFIVVFLLMFHQGLMSQGNYNAKTDLSTRKSGVSKNHLQSFRGYFLNPKTLTSDFKNNPGRFDLRPVPRNYVVAGFGFFCRQEFRIEKITTIPFRFRLGSLDYVNWMEGKPGPAKVF